MWWKISRISTTIIIICVFTMSANAQTQSSAILTQFHHESFPNMTFFLDVYDGEGNFLHGLQSNELKVFEDDQIATITTFKEYRTGVQLVVAINPGESFKIRNSQGYSRYDTIIEMLVNWGRIRLGSTIDDLSILVTEGPEQTHISNPLELFYTLVDYDIEKITAIPTLDTLYRAVEIASDPTPRPGMKRVVLFITAPIEGDTTFGIQNVISQASQNGVHIHIWQVSLLGGLDLEAAANFIELTNKTGSSYFAFSGSENIPDPEQYLEPLRNYYFVGYDSTIRTSGSHQLSVKIEHENQLIPSPTFQFDFRLEPPNPLFLAPVLQIDRKQIETENSGLLRGLTGSSKDLIPEYQDYQILIDFPDGRHRSITSSTLYVDKQEVDKNSITPFDQFRWDISNYRESRQHVLYVEVVDEFGLKGRTIETPVNIRVDLPKNSILSFLSENLSIVAAFVGVLSGALLLLILILGGKIKPGPVISGMSRRRKRKNDVVDPLISKVVIHEEKGVRDKIVLENHGRAGSIKSEPKIFTYLELISNAENHEKTLTIPIVDSEIIIGKGPDVDLMVVDPSVDERHARITCTKQGSYKIMDEGSIAGTWVNYAPVSKEGVVIRNGDLIHIGRVGYRLIQSEG